MNLSFLNGKKTYLTGWAICVLVFANWQGWIKVPTEAYAGLAALMIMFLRSGVSRELGETLADASAATPAPAPGPIPSNLPGGSGKAILGLILGLILVAAAVGLSGMVTGCKSTLETGGAYAQTNAAPDRVFFETDAAFNLAYSAVDGALKFERENRALLWRVSPQIKHTLDGIRPQAFQAAKDYAVARSAYLLAPAPAGLTTLQTILARIQQFSAAAVAVLPSSTTTTTTAPAN